MRNLLVILFLFAFTCAKAQFHARQKSRFNFFSPKISSVDFKIPRSAPVFTVIPGNNSIFSQSSYWQGGSYTSYSGNGRFRSTYSFDVQGVIRESKASFSLKKNGALSYWRVQFSQQRHRPLIVYTIHN